MKNDLELRSSKKAIEPLLFNDQKIKRKKFANWVRTNFQKEDTVRMNSLCRMRNFVDIDGVYNSHNDRLWAGDRADVNKKCGMKQKRKFPQKAIV